MAAQHQQNGDAFPAVNTTATAASSTAELTSADLHGPADQDMLRFGSYQFAIEADSLLVLDNGRQQKKQSRTCGFAIASDTSSSSSSAARSIPLYNILWASLSDDARTLTIDHAEHVSKTRLRPASLAYTISTSSPEAPEAPEAPPNTNTDADAAAAAAAAATSWISHLLSRSYGPAALRKRAYVLVNPHAGPGGADKKYETQVRPLFEAARMRLTAVTTTHPGAAVDLCAALDIDAYDVVVACSGDGLPHECFNGLGRRPDARRALGRVAVCHIPCGSGNAMACNLYGTHRPSLAALAIVKGAPTPMDLVSITQMAAPGDEGEGDQQQQQQPRRLLSFLSQALGIVAEADLATENLRWMGGARFTWGFLERFLARRVYPCDLAVKVEIEHKDGVREHYSRQRAGSSTTSGLVMGGGSNGGSKLSLAAAAAGDTASDATSSGASDEGLPPLRYGTVNDKLPEGWELIPHDKMGNFYCGNMAYMAPDANFFSAACINDGLMDLVTIDGDIPPLKSLQMLLSVETGRFFDNPLVQYRKISGFRIVPRDQDDGYISIDGERVPFAPFQAEVHRGLGTVLTRRGGYEAPGPRDWDKVSAADRFMA